MFASACTFQIRPISVFYSAEFYHHKYYLSHKPELVAALASCDGIKDISSVSVDDYAGLPLLLV